MSTVERKPVLDLLKDLSALLVAAAALLYVFGFAAHWAYFRLLGLDIKGQPLDYLRFAADYITAIIGSLPQLLFAFVYYAPKLIAAPLLKITIPCFLILLIAFALYVRPLKTIKVRKGRLSIVLWWTLSILTVGSFWLLFQTELDIAKVRDVLQPVDSAYIQEMQGQLSDSQNTDTTAPLEIRSRNVAQLYERYTQMQRDAPGSYYFNAWFNPTINPENSQARRSVYLALLLLNLILLLGGILQLLSFRTPNVDGSAVNVHERIGPRWAHLVILIIAVGLAIQTFLFPFIYATVGRNLTYPIVRLKLTALSEVSGSKTGNEESAKPEPNTTDAKANLSRSPDSWTHAVYLIVDGEDEVIIFDRLNFFQVKRVPRSRILNLSQISAASPFESCSKDQNLFTPCETLWIPAETQVRDF